jgi:enterochelin esterase-like enzyme
MGLTDASTLVAAFALLAAWTVATLMSWGRLDSLKRWRWPIRVSMLASCQVLAVGAAGLSLNRTYDFYVSWSELLGQHATSHSRQADQGLMDNQLAPLLRTNFEAHKGTVLSIFVPGVRSGLPGAPASVYLPAAYGDPAYANRTFPVVELISGYPGSPQSWIGVLHVVAMLDNEMRLGSTVPFIAVIPTSNPKLPRDTECVNAVGGAQVDTYLASDVRSSIDSSFRADSSGQQWGVMGYSTGGYCAANLAMRHPTDFRVVVSLSGYDRTPLDSQTGNLFRGSKISANLNDVVWRAQHLPSPNLDILLFATMQEPASVRDVRRFEQAARPPLQLWDVILPRGGHNRYTWISEMPTAFGWMSRYLASPLLPVPSVDGLLPVSSSPRTVGPVSSSPKRIVHTTPLNARSPVHA